MKQDFYEVHPMEKSVAAKIEVPGSKSITNRALLLAALADGESILEGTLVSDDARHFLLSLQSLGFSIRTEREGRRVVIKGAAGRRTGGDNRGGGGICLPEKNGRIYVGSAGTAARFLTAMLGLSDGEYIIDASEQMKKRPMKPLLLALQALGAGIRCLEVEGCLPVRIVGAGAGDGAGLPETVDLDISESTQFLSALLMTAPMRRDGLKIHITSEKKDGSYVRITRNMMKDFGVEVVEEADGYRILPGAGYRARHYRIEPDMSAACYFYAAAAITGSRVTVRGVHRDISQGDIHFLSVLRQMGCGMRESEEGICLTGADKLSGIRLNMNDFSDQALTLAAIAPFADGPVEISGIAHIRGQECDRLHAMAENLTRAGIKVEEREDGILIFPGKPQACRIETFDDHRVAMSFALLGLRARGIQIMNPGCCAKTFPEYFGVLEAFSAADA